MSLIRRFARMRGFTILEMVVVLAVMAAIAAFLAPAAFQALQASRETATSEQLRRISVAIVGEPSKGNYGYLGDMGRLPASLDDLITQGAQTAWHTTSHVGSVGRGWRGPYITGGEAAADLFDDAWGLPLTYSNVDTTISGVAIKAGQIVSGGPDGQLSTTADNITYPVQTPIKTKGTIIVTVVVNEIPQPGGLTVRVYSTTNGDEGTAVVKTTTTPSDGKPFLFDDVPQGTSAIETVHVSGATTVTRTTTIDVGAGTQLSRTIIMKTSASVVM